MWWLRSRLWVLPMTSPASHTFSELWKACEYLEIAQRAAMLLAVRLERNVQVLHRKRDSSRRTSSWCGSSSWKEFRSF